MWSIASFFSKLKEKENNNYVILFSWFIHRHINLHRHEEKKIARWRYHSQTKFQNQKKKKNPKLDTTKTLTITPHHSHSSIDPNKKQKWNIFRYQYFFLRVIQCNIKTLYGIANERNKYPHRSNFWTEASVYIQELERFMKIMLWSILCFVQRPKLNEKIKGRTYPRPITDLEAKTCLIFVISFN